MDNDFIEQPDPANLVNADALEELLHGTSNAPTHDQLMDEEPPVAAEPDLPDAGDQADMVDSESAATVVVEQFPVGNPGAPIPDRAQGSTYDSQAACMDSLWAPFQSQLDWDMAHWAKLRGPIFISSVGAACHSRGKCFQYNALRL